MSDLGEDIERSVSGRVGDLHGFWSILLRLSVVVIPLAAPFLVWLVLSTFEQRQNVALIQQDLMSVKAQMSEPRYTRTDAIADQLLLKEALRAERELVKETLLKRIERVEDTQRALPR